MRLLFVGDVFGRSGRAALAAELPQLRRRWKLDAVVVNGENAAGIAGITEDICSACCLRRSESQDITTCRRTASSCSSSTFWLYACFTESGCLLKRSLEILEYILRFFPAWPPT